MKTPNLQAPSQTQEQSKTKEYNKSNTLIIVVMAVIICILIIIIISLLKPSPIIENNHTDDNSSHVVTHEESAKKTAEIKDKKISEKEITTSINEQIKIEWMLKKNNAEIENIAVWATKDYETILTNVQQAEQFIKDKFYDKAEQTYKKAITDTDGVLSNKQIILEQFIQSGIDLLEKNELKAAKKELEIAIKIDENNKQAKRLLQRISNREEVNKLLDLAEIKREENDITSTITLLEQALKIEPEYQLIKDILSKLNAIKKEQAFNHAIDHSMKALDNNKLLLAEKHLIQAKKINPGKTIIDDLKNRIAIAQRNNTIRKLQSRAKKFENKEHWISANKDYQKILIIDPNLNEILVVQQRVSAYIRLNKILDQIILKPERMQNSKVLEKSKKSISYVKKELMNNSKLYYSNKKTPQLIEKINQASKLVKDAKVQVDVIIKSDNKTEVVIYKVAQYGILIEKKIQLRPGKYTIVGSRSGYRDYRKIITISASDKARYIRVVCNEKI